MIRRYLRALMGAIRMTLSGKTVPPSPLTGLRAWMTHTPALVDAVLTACAQDGLDEAARRQTSQVIEGRRVNLNTILLAPKFHAQYEYALLLKAPDGRSLAALYGTNVNDCFLLERFIKILPTGHAPVALRSLVTHLEAVPVMQPETLNESS